ncbi:MAG: hypothetical protein WA931_13895 [Rhodococcus sp. (in: high G+C Gram-positive bacteria)]
MGDFIRVPITELEQIGQNLTAVRTGMTAEQNKSRQINGMDKHGDQVIPPAEGSFYDQWRTSIDKLLEGIGLLSDVSVGIATGARDIDNAVVAQGNNMTSQVSAFDFHLSTGGSQ